MRLFINQSKVLLWKNIDFVVFVFLVGWSLTAAKLMNRSYQDNWILEDLWFNLFLLLVTYLFIISRRSDLQQITVLTFIFTFLLNMLPVLKYTFIYGSTTDTAFHLSFSESIARTGKLMPAELYSSTPGFHVLSAIFSQMSGLKIDTVEKILPSLLGSFVPLCLYILCKRSSMPTDLAKWIIVLSSLSLPLLYGLNGTSFTVPIFFCLLTFVILRSVAPGENEFQYTLIILLFILQILFWHPGTSLVYPIIFVMAGIFSFILLNLKVLPARTRGFLAIGILAAVCTFSYWMYSANFVWSHFVKNIEVIFQREITPKLIPVRLFQLSIGDQAVFALLYHARDGILLITTFVGLFFLAIRRGDERFRLCLYYVASVFISSFTLLAIIFIINFGAQGYTRFLIYPVAFSPVIAGYGLWEVSKYLQKKMQISERLIFPLVFLIIYLISCAQLYPFQNIIPSLTTSSFNSKSSPILWMHQVNSINQYHMLDYALTRIESKDQMLTDDIGTHQEYIFFGLDSPGRFRHWLNPAPEPALLLLHWPGISGAYLERLELRSMDRINLLRTMEHMNTIYDNGYSFILYYPDNIQNIGVK